MEGRLFIKMDLAGHGTGDSLAIRRVRGSWVLSYHESGPADSTSYWVNLHTGAAVIGAEGDPLFVYSPDGNWVIAESRLYRALGWPAPPFRPVAYAGVVRYNPVTTNPKDEIPLRGWPYHWSSDSKYILTEVPNQDPEQPSRHYRVVDITLKKITGGFGTNVSWVGNDRLLVMVPDKDFWRAYLRPLSGGMARKFFGSRSGEVGGIVVYECRTGT